MNKESKIHDLKVLAAQIRVETLKIIASLGSGHVGGSMSLADTFAVLYGDVLNVDPKDPLKKDRDWCILSKGHAGPVMYAALGLKGYYDVKDAYTLNRFGTNFPSHTSHLYTKGVDMTTGSLGQGISQAVGVALGNKLQNINSYTYVIIGDGEADEGQVWEAAQFAAHYHLDNLICLVDNNKRQLDGLVDDVMSHGKGIQAKFDAFGWHTIDVKDGNDVEQIYDAINDAKKIKDKPIAIILNTIKGKGAYFAEETGEHSSKPSKEVMDKAIDLAQQNLDKIIQENN